MIHLPGAIDMKHQLNKDVFLMMDNDNEMITEFGVRWSRNKKMLPED